MQHHDLQNIFELAAFFVGLAVAGGVLLMWDISRNATCRYCDHCRDKKQRDQVAQAKKRHEAYHAFGDRAPSACDNPDCPGRR